MLQEFKEICPVFIYFFAIVCLIMNISLHWDYTGSDDSFRYIKESPKRFLQKFIIELITFFILFPLAMQEYNLFLSIAIMLVPYQAIYYMLYFIFKRVYKKEVQ